MCIYIYTMCMCVCVMMYLCMIVCVSVCLSVSLSVCIYVCLILYGIYSIQFIWHSGKMVPVRFSPPRALQRLAVNPSNFRLCHRHHDPHPLLALLCPVGAGMPGQWGGTKILGHGKHSLL
jgi:hypothetical protein